MCLKHNYSVISMCIVFIINWENGFLVMLLKKKHHFNITPAWGRDVSQDIIARGWALHFVNWPGGGQFTKNVNLPPGCPGGCTQSKLNDALLPYPGQFHMTTGSIT